MANKAHFEVLALPIGKGRPKFSKFTSKSGKDITTVRTPEKTVNFENLIRMEYAAQCPGVYFTKQMSAKIVAVFPVPKSTPKKKTALMLAGTIMHTHKPDADNLAKAVLDALNKTAYDDDSSVVNLLVKKRYGERPMVIVDLTEID